MLETCLFAKVVHDLLFVFNVKRNLRINNRPYCYSLGPFLLSGTAVVGNHDYWGIRNSQRLIIKMEWWSAKI